jgi:hypothetical protein
LVEDLDTLENIDKINFNQHQQVKRLPAPSFIIESDTHVSVTNIDFDWPYATFVTADNKEIKVVDNEPISLWSKESKNILITSTGGTHIVVPKEAKEYVDMIDKIEYFDCITYDCETRTLIFEQSEQPEIRETLNNKRVIPYNQTRIKNFLDCFNLIVQEMKSL